MYALYFPEEGKYSILMPWPKVKVLAKHFQSAYIVDRHGMEV